MIRTLIIEDETLAANRLKRLLKNIDPNIEIIQSIESLTNAVNYLSENQKKVDLIFLDIHLSDGSSFEIFEEIQVEIPIIFTTAYDKYAIQAFKQNSVDYLLKPISESQLQNSVEKYKKLFQTNKTTTFDYNEIAQLLQPDQPNYKKRFLVYVGSKIRSIAVEEIAFFYAEQGAIFFHTYQGKTYDINYTLEKLTHLVDLEQFYRVNRKFIVHINAIQEAYQFSRNRLKLNLDPKPNFDVFVPLDRIAAFKRWFSR